MQTPQSTWEHLHRVPFKAGKNKLACLAELVDGWQSLAIQTFLNEFVICYCNEELPATPLLV